MDFDKKTKRTIIFLAFICILFFLAVKNIGAVTGGFNTILGIFTPFIIGAAIAFVINVPMVRVERFLFSEEQVEKLKSKKDIVSKLLLKSKRGISFIITLALVVGVLAIAINIIVPQLATTMQAVAKEIPKGISDLQGWIADNTEMFNKLANASQKINFDWENIATEISKTLQGWAKNLVNSGFSTVSDIVSGMVSFVIGVVFAVYVLLQKEKLVSNGKQLLYSIFSEHIVDRIIYILDLTNNTFARFITGQCLEACVLGLMFFIAMSIIGLPYALMISVLIAISALIPIVGAFIGLVVGCLLILMVSPAKVLMFIILFEVLQQIEGNFIYPYVVGNSVGLPAIWVLVAVTIGANLMGVLGMIIFIPLCSVVYSITNFYVKESLERRGVNPSKWLEPADISRDSLRLKKHQE